MENRNFMRVQFPECASIKYDGQMFFANIKNASLQGLYINTNQKLPVNTPLQITVYLSPNSSIYLSAEVVRCEETGMGVQIQRMDVNSFVNLRNAISLHSNDHDQIMRETYKITDRIH
jgi:hypothetical protein